MKSRVLIIECGVAETRAALIVDDIVRHFWFGPAGGDEASEITPQPGARFAGRVTKIDKQLDAAFVDLGLETPGHLELPKGAAPLSEGALIGVEVKRAPRGSKGATLGLLEKATIVEAVGFLEAPEAATLQAVAALGEGVDEIVLDQGAEKASLEKQYQGAARIGHRDADLFREFGADIALEQSFARMVTLPSGGRLLIDETEALTAIDIDTSTMAAASSARLAARVNLEAVEAIALELSRRALGGKIVIDFLPERKQTLPILNKALKAHLQILQKAYWTPSGLFTFVKSRPQASLLERFTEPSEVDPAPGRRFNVAFLARQGIWRLEKRLRKETGGRFNLRIGREIATYCNQRSEWVVKLRERYGARFEIIVDSNIEECGFDLSEQR